MRSYIRHPSDIPIRVDSTSTDVTNHGQMLNNISYGGLSFISESSVKIGLTIQLKIDSVNPVFEAEGLVTHCHVEEGKYVIGIEFIRRDDMFVARMVEQVCHIEHYKREMAQQEGRELSGEEAAREWIEKYAANFPCWSA